MESLANRMERREALWNSVVLAVTVLGITTTNAFAQTAAPVPKSIAADQARKHVGDRVTVQFKVLHTKAAKEPDRVYLDSEKDYRDPRNLGVLIEADALPSFAKVGIKNPAAHYDGKTIRITGNLFLRDDNVFIRAKAPGDIKIVDDKSGG
ncbi:hypothetical protein Pan44_35960 [Caulifigura coniformis]|uniref:Uncharacterized protein n=1 Tax=Caulifigura coniformis TaxID=2527983 RepID=A0A517SHG2_9PLAN|nr:hypothetical protein [Caulifigura coniformis]QDT55552.1 hypothetical protein Pan44_35960 [Caulifigura coniformis]